MANYGAVLRRGLLHRTPLDLDAALAAAATRCGYRRVVLLGYSLGATMVTHYQALRRRPDVVGLCTLAHPLSLPARCAGGGRGSAPSPDYEELEARARPVLAADPTTAQEDEIFIVRRAHGYDRRARRRRDLDLPQLVVLPRARGAPRRLRRAHRRRATCRWP